MVISVGGLCKVHTGHTGHTHGRMPPAGKQTTMSTQHLKMVGKSAKKIYTKKSDFSKEGIFFTRKTLLLFEYTP